MMIRRPEQKESICTPQALIQDGIKMSLVAYARSREPQHHDDIKQHLGARSPDEMQQVFMSMVL